MVSVRKDYGAAGVWSSGWERGEKIQLQVCERDVSGFEKWGQVVVGDNARGLAVCRGREEVHILWK